MYIPRNKGYTLLLAVLTSTVLLLIAIFIVQITRKQFILASAARDSQYAFVAADAGIECAIVNYDNGFFDQNKMSQPNDPVNGALGTISCANQTAGTSYLKPTGAAPWKYDPIAPNNSNATTSFMLPVSGGPSCMWVKVGYHKDSANNVKFIIESRGYNIGWTAGSQDCGGYGPRKVERALRLTYQ